MEWQLISKIIILEKKVYIKMEDYRTNMTSTTTNANIQELLDEIKELTGQRVGTEHIHPSTAGREDCIQAPKTGAPMLLHHYRGSFFVDIHPDDFQKISSGEISPHEYITNANWLVGYYWGGNGGSYYQPLDIVGRKDEVRRYLKILSCRGFHQSCGYMPSEKNCDDCSVENCPFSKYKQGDWAAEMPEPDPRRDLFRALLKRFEEENHGYSLRGFLCGEIPDGEIWIYPNGHYTEDELFTFTAYASDSVIRSLLMHETEPKNWVAYAQSFQFRIHKLFDKQSYDVCEETLEKAFEGQDYTKKAKTEPEPEDDIYEEKAPLLTRLAKFFKKMF